MQTPHKAIAEFAKEEDTNFAKLVIPNGLAFEIKEMACVTGNIFTYENLKEKAQREIARLENAELAMDKHVVDYALNAAFTVYHLLQWKDKESDENSNKKAGTLCEESNNPALKMLHNIVTCTKHVKVDNPKHPTDINISPEENITEYAAEDGVTKYVAEDGITQYITEDSKLAVKFDDKKALDILREALKEFDGN